MGRNHVCLHVVPTYLTRRSAFVEEASMERLYEGCSLRNALVIAFVPFPPGGLAAEPPR